jgi:hypothetical protein
VPHYCCLFAAGLADCTSKYISFTHFCPVTYATYLLPQLSTKKLQILICDFPTYLYIVRIIVFKRTLFYSQLSQNQFTFFHIHHKTAPCDTLKMKITIFVTSGFMNSILIFFSECVRSTSYYELFSFHRLLQLLL